MRCHHQVPIAFASQVSWRSGRGVPANELQQSWRGLSKTAPDMIAAFSKNKHGRCKRGVLRGPVSIRSTGQLFPRFDRVDRDASFPSGANNGVRSIDDGSLGRSGANFHGHMVEKVAVPNTDYARTVARASRHQIGGSLPLSFNSRYIQAIGKWL